MLDRVGDGRARATSIVRYEAGARFPHHQHPGGEEILVLSGTFSDEDGHYPAGWYLRNPPGSGHRPFSDDGAVIFVKLWQMPPHETRCVRIDTNDPRSWQREGRGEVCPLFSADEEQVCLLRLAGGQAVFPDPVDSAELLVLASKCDHTDGKSPFHHKPGQDGLNKSQMFAGGMDHRKGSDKILALLTSDLKL